MSGDGCEVCSAQPVKLKRAKRAKIVIRVQPHVCPPCTRAHVTAMTYTPVYGTTTTAGPSYKG